MIARVKIAPMEQWCNAALQHAVGKLEEGRIITIDTNSMTMDTDLDTKEEFRSWRLTGESLEWLRSITGGANSICEHVLEMD